MLHRPISSTADAAADRVDVDFSLAIHNRTGKYFIGRDLLEIEGLPLGRTYYWGVSADNIPSGLFGKILGRLQLYHIRGQALGGPLRVWPRRRPQRPLLHLDPFTVPSTVLRRRDAVLCHDLGPLTHPELFDAEVGRIYRPIYDEIARVGPHLVFVSEASRRQFSTLFPNARPASERVIYPAIRTGVTDTPAQPMLGVAQPFLLTVGGIGDRKNQLGCIHAFAKSGLAEAGIGYVMCGPREPGYEAVAEAAGRTQGVTLLPYVGDAELRWLYASASGFVLMSRLEGFGMPVAEAIAHRQVPLVTRGSVLHEVAGDGALLAQAEDTLDIAGRMRELARMGKAERTQRLGALTTAVARFEIEGIRERWRAAFADILTAARAE